MTRPAACLSLAPAMSLMTVLAVGAEVPDGPGKKEDPVPKLDGAWQGFAVEGKGEKPDR